MDGLFGDGLVDVLCGDDSLEEDLRWGPRLGALVDFVEFVDGITDCGVTLFKTVEALSSGAFFFSTSVELKTKGAGGGGAGRGPLVSALLIYSVKIIGRHVFQFHLVYH